MAKDKILLFKYNSQAPIVWDGNVWRWRDKQKTVKVGKSFEITLRKDDEKKIIMIGNCKSCNIHSKITVNWPGTPPVLVKEMGWMHNMWMNTQKLCLYYIKWCL